MQRTLRRLSLPQQNVVCWYWGDTFQILHKRLQIDIIIDNLHSLLSLLIETTQRSPQVNILPNSSLFYDQSRGRPSFCTSVLLLADPRICDRIFVFLREIRIRAGDEDKICFLKSLFLCTSTYTTVKFGTSLLCSYCAECFVTGYSGLAILLQRLMFH